MIDWEEYRLSDGSLDLVRAYQDNRHLVTTRYLEVDTEMAAIDYLNSIISLTPIKSRQLAAVIVVQAALF